MNRGPRPHARSRSGGVTMIELVYAMALLALLGAVLLPLGASGLRAYATVRSDVTQQDQLRYALERMAREVREVRFLVTGEAVFLSLTPHSVRFTRNRLVGATESTETVTLSLDGTDLTLAYASMAAVGPQLLLPSVSRLAFVGLNEAQQAVLVSQPPSAAELVVLHAVRIEVEVTTAAGRTLVRHTTVQLKNRELS